MLNKGQWKCIEYENTPAYCPYCKYQGYIINECIVKVTDEQVHQRIEQEARKKDRNKAGKKIFEINNGEGNMQQSLEPSNTTQQMHHIKK